MSALDLTSTTQRREEWPFIVAWCRIMGSYEYYITEEIARAVHRALPRDACSVGSWDESFKPMRLATLQPGSLARVIRVAESIFPHSPLVTAAKERYADALAA